MIVGLVALAGLGGFLAGRWLPRTDDRRPRPEAHEVLARFEGGEVTSADLRAYVEEVGPNARERARTTEGAKEIVQELVDRALLVNAARASALDREPAVMARMDELLAREYRQRVLEKGTRSEEIPAAEVQRAFDAELPRLSLPERVRVAIIFVAADDAKRTEKRNLAQRYLDEAVKAMKSSPDGFASVARARSEDEQTRGLGGQLPYLGKEELEKRFGPAVAEQAYALTHNGELVKAPIETNDGYVVLRLLGREPARVPTLAQLEPRIRAQLSSELVRGKYESWLREERERANVRLDEGNVARAAVDLGK